MSDSAEELPPDEPKRGRHGVIRSQRADKLKEKKTGKAMTEFQALHGDLFDERNPLQPWMKVYAVWVASKAGYRTPRTEHERAATKACGYMISEAALRNIRARKDFKAYVESLTADRVELAKQALQQDLPYYVETHKEATEKLMEAAKEDPRLYGKIAPLTSPMLDRAAPKREERAPGQQIVVINLGRADSEAAKLLKKVEDVIDVEFEEIRDE